MTNTQIDKTSTDLVHLNVPVTRTIRRDVKMLAVKEGKTVAQIVAEILASGVAQRQQGGVGQTA